MSTSSTLIPVLPLRDVVVYPHMVIPLFVGRDKSIKALERAMDETKQILLVAQRSAADDNPRPQDIHEIGTISNILQLLRLPDGTIKVLVEGVQRARVRQFEDLGYMFAAETELLDSVTASEREMEVLTRSLMNQFEQYVKINKKVPP